MRTFATLAVLAAIVFAQIAAGASVTPSTNGFILKLNTAMTWSSARYGLRQLICDGSYCPGYGPNWDLYVQGIANSSVKATEFTVSCNTSWMLIQALSIPEEALVARDSDFSNITKATSAALPDIDKRGPNQIAMTSRYTYYSGARSSWYPFVQIQDNIMDGLYNSANESDMVLVNASCVYTTDKYYNCSWIVSVLYVTEIVEITGINWVNYNKEITKTWVTSAVTYPLGTEINSILPAANLGYRVRFSFLYTYGGTYEEYLDFASDVRSAINSYSSTIPRGITVKSWDMNLVNCTTNFFPNGSVSEQFTISFSNRLQKMKVFNLQADDKLDRYMSSYYLKYLAVEDVSSPTPIPTLPPVTMPGGATPAPVGPTLGTSVNGFVVTLTSARTWYSVRSDLRNLICSSNDCPGYYSDWDLYVIGLRGKSSTMATQFAVSCNQSWILIQALAVPKEAMQAQDPRFYSIETVEALPALETRGYKGSNFLTINSTYDYYLGAQNSWYPFVEIRNDVMDYLYDSVNETDAILADATCVFDNWNQFYNCSYIVSFKYATEANEILSINWADFTKNDIISSNYYVNSVALYPASLPSLDFSRYSEASRLFNRVQYNMMYDYSYRPYYTFDRFSSNIVSTFSYQDDVAPKDLYIRQYQLNLVWANATSFTNGSVYQQMTVSFPTPEAAAKAISLTNQGLNYYFSSNADVYAAVARPNPAPIAPLTDAPAPKKGGDGSDDKKSKVPLIAGVIIAVVVVIVIVVIVAKKAGGGGAADGEKRDEVSMNSQSV